MYTKQQIIDYTNEVKDIVSNYKSYGMIFKKKQYLYDFVEWRTKDCLSDSFYTFRTKLYWIAYDLTKFPRCKECGKEMTFKNVDSVQIGYRDFCSNSCAQKNKEVQLKVHSHTQNTQIKENDDILNVDFTELSNSELIGHIRKLSKSNMGLMKVLMNTYNKTYNELIKRTSFLKNCDQNEKLVPIGARLFCIEHELTSHPTCHHSNCNNMVKWNSGKNEFNHFCCDKCRSLSSEFKEQVKKTSLEKYGTESPSQSKIVRDKYKVTCFEKWGVTNIGQTCFHHKTKRHKYQSAKYPGKTFASTWEVKVYEFCMDNKIDVECQPNCVFTYSVDGKVHTYHPDFKINGKIYEVKGDHFFKINESGVEEMCYPYRKNLSNEEFELRNRTYKEKYKCMLKNNVIILRKRDLNRLNEVFNHANSI